MGRDDLVELLRVRPFPPFRIHTTDGQSYEVRHPEMVLVTRTRTTIGIPDPNETWPHVSGLMHVALIHITRLEPIEAART